MGKMEVLVGGACVFGIRNGRAGVPNAGEDEGIGSDVPILKRSGCRGVDVGSMVSVLSIGKKVRASNLSKKSDHRETKMKRKRNQD